MKAKTIFTILLIAAILVPIAGAAYVLKNNGTITINHGALYVDGVTVDQYIIGLVGVGGGNFDQSLNTTDDVTFENVTVTDSITLGGVTRNTWTTSETDYTITTDGATYYAQNGTTGETLQNTSLSGLWNTINSITSGPVVEFTAGHFTVDAPLVIQSADTAIFGQGPQATFLELGTGVNDDIIQMTTYYHNIQIKHLLLDGSRTVNTLGKGIDFNVNPATYGGGSEYWGWFAIDDIEVTECDEQGIYIRTQAGLHTEGYICNFRIWDNDGGTNGHQLELIRIFDMTIGGNGHNSVSSIRINACASNHFINIYVGGGIDNLVSIEGGDATYTTTGNIFTNVRFDNPYGSALTLKDYAIRNSFTGCTFTNLGQAAANNTYPAISVEGNAKFNTFFGCYIGHYNIKTEDRWTYAYQEVVDGYSKLIGCVSGHGVILGGVAEHFTQNEADLVGGSHTIISECYKDDGNVWGID